MDVFKLAVIQTKKVREFIQLMLLLRNLSLQRVKGHSSMMLVVQHSDLNLVQMQMDLLIFQMV